MFYTQNQNHSVKDLLKRWFASALSLLVVAGGLLPLTQVKADTTITNLISNPSAETLQNGKPVNWTANDWGTSTTSLTTTTDAHTGTTALSVTTSGRTDGDAKWVPDAVAVTAGQQYTFSDYSKATVATQLDAAYISSTGSISYAYLNGVQASTSWQANNVSFTIPAGVQQVQILHILPTNGTLTTDDFSLTTQQAVVPPAPTGDNLIANPSMSTGTSSAPAGWQSDSWGTNTATATYITNDGHTDTTSAQVQISNYTDGDAKWYFAPVAAQASTSYTFSDYYKATTATQLIARFDDGTGNYTYSNLITPGASSAWAQTSATFTTPSNAKYVTVLHVLTADGTLQTDDASLTTGAATNPANPTVSISAPITNASVNGTINVTAAASAQTAITKVQFQLDGVNLGTAVTAAPYQISWDTTAVSNGTHTLTAVMTANKVATPSTAVTVTVNNQAATGGNSVLNSGLETVSSTNKKLPANWTSGSWGTNTAAFTYTTSATTAHTGTHAIKTQITAYTSGAAYWYNAPVAVTGGQAYDFKDYYKSNIPSEIDANVTMTDGSVQSLYIGTAFASPNSWTKFELQFTMPSGAKSVSITHSIYQVGYLMTDDYSLMPFTYQGFSRALVSITDDDGFASMYTNGLPVLQKYNLPATAYMISSYTGQPDYMTAAQIKTMKASGIEIGSHSVDHPDLSTLTAAKQDAELKNSQATLQTLLGTPVTDYAAPYGAYNQQIVTDAQKYYGSYRGVQSGYNARNNFDAMNLQVQNITSATTTAQVQAWLQQAALTNTWLILVYHEINTTPSDTTYNTLPTDFDSQMAAVKNSGLTVETVAQALAEVKSQL